jgi:hypothetical protein
MKQVHSTKFKDQDSYLLHTKDEENNIFAG